MKPRAVLVTLWAHHFGALDAFLAEYGPVTLLVPANAVSPALTEVAQRHGCEAIATRRLLAPTFRAGRRLNSLTADLRAQLANWAPPGSDEATRELLHQLVEARMEDDLRMAVTVLESLAAARQEYDIVLFATTEDVTARGRLVAAWARDRHVPSLHLAHSIALADPATVHTILMAERLAVYGTRGAEGYLDLGIARERITVTGNPAWDAYADLAGRRPELRALLDTEYGLDPTLPLVVFGTTWSGHMTALEPPGDTNAASLRAFVDACEELGRAGVAVNAVIKDRPTNAARGAETLAGLLAAGEPKLQTYFRTTAHTQEFAAAADVMVGVDSNYLVEAMLVGTPVVNLVAEGLARLGPTFDEESGVVEAEPHELAARLGDLLQDGEFRAARLAQIADRIGYYNHGGISGGSAQRVGRLMVTMARQPRRGQVSAGGRLRAGWSAALAWLDR